jgi:hypothetical protein
LLNELFVSENLPSSYDTSLLSSYLKHDINCENNTTTIDEALIAIDDHTGDSVILTE